MCASLVCPGTEAVAVTQTQDPGEAVTMLSSVRNLGAGRAGQGGHLSALSPHLGPGATSLPQRGLFHSLDFSPASWVALGCTSHRGALLGPRAGPVPSVLSSVFGAGPVSSFLGSRSRPFWGTDWPCPCGTDSGHGPMQLCPGRATGCLSGELRLPRMGLPGRGPWARPRQL